jgi:glucarate dehydratase
MMLVEHHLIINLPTTTFQSHTNTPPMIITHLEAYSVAVPFIAPIFSAYGVSYPARLRTFIRVHTDVGLIGVGEAGVSATHAVERDAQLRLFERTVAPRIRGESPFDYRLIMQKLGNSAESMAVELACWDLMGKRAGAPVYRLLGGEGVRRAIPTAAYFFFRGKDHHGEHEVTLDNCVDHVLSLIERYGFRTVKMKLGVHDPLDEADAVARVRAAIGPKIRLRVDPNGCWSLPVAKRMLKILEPLDLEFVEEPLKWLPSRVPVSTQAGVPSVDTTGLAALRRSGAVPIAADGAYRIDFLRQVEREQAADVVLGDIQGANGIRGLHDFFTVAHVLGLAASLHSGTELGVQQVAKLHVAAAHPEITIAGDAIYPEYVDDVLVGGKLAIEDGSMLLPQGPGLGVELDDAKLAQYELTEQKHREYDEFWREIKADYKIPAAGADLLVRRF